jgi:hypothetical protein
LQLREILGGGVGSQQIVEILEQVFLARLTKGQATDFA